MKYLLIVFLIVISASFISSCRTKPSENLNNKINLILRNQNNSVDEKEWNSLVAYVDSNQLSFKDLLGANQKVDPAKLKEKILDAASHRRGKEMPDIFEPQSKIGSLFKPTIKVFIENSGSMDGYVNGTTEFEAALSDLLVQIQYQYDKENLNINFINTKIYPSQVSEVKDFVEALEPGKSPYKVGDRSTSKLNEILKLILDSTSEKDISIFVSDCIYSLDKNKNTQGALEFEKSLTKGAFLEKSKQFNFATIVLKMKSKFDGSYWKKDNSSEFLPNLDRPYYIWILGANNPINELSRKIKLQSLKGFENSYSLSNRTNEKQPYYTVLKETNKIGSFKQADRHQSDVKSIEDIKYDNGQLQFAIAVDLSGVAVDSAYLKSAKNYEVSEGFVVKSIEKINRNKLSQRDMLIVERTSATHIITVSTTDKYTIQNLKIELSNKIPIWVDESSSLDDSNIKRQLNKTFGFAYLVQGVSEAYATQNPEQESYFIITVQISKEKSSGSPLSTILITIFTIVIMAFIILVLVKRRNQN